MVFFPKTRALLLLYNFCNGSETSTYPDSAWMGDRLRSVIQYLIGRVVCNHYNLVYDTRVFEFNIPKMLIIVLFSAKYHVGIENEETFLGKLRGIRSIIHEKRD